MTDCYTHCKRFVCGKVPKRANMRTFCTRSLYTLALLEAIGKNSCKIVIHIGEICAVSCKNVIGIGDFEADTEERGPLWLSPRYRL